MQLYWPEIYIKVSNKHGSRLFGVRSPQAKGREEAVLAAGGEGPDFPTVLWGPSSHCAVGLGNAVARTPDHHLAISELPKLVFYPLFQCLLTQESGKWERKGRRTGIRWSPALPAWKQRLTLITPLRPVFEQTYFLYELMHSDLLFYILFII